MDIPIASRNTHTTVAGTKCSVSKLSLGEGETWLYCIRKSPGYDATSVLARHPGGKAAIFLSGSGITPGYALLARTALCESEGEEEADVKVRVLDANKSESDILLGTELEDLEKESHGRVKVTHVLSHPSEAWKGLEGHINEEVNSETLFSPEEEGAVVFLCGPPGLIRKGAVPVLRDWGYEEDKDMFGF